MLESFVENKFEIRSIYETQYTEENSPLKFTEQICKMLIVQLSLCSLLERCMYVRDLEHANDANCATFKSTGTKYIHVVSFPVKILQNSVANFPEIVQYIIQSRQL